MIEIFVAKKSFQDEKNGDLTQAQFYASYKVQLDVGANSVVDFSNGNPAIVEDSRGDGKVIVFCSLPDLEWSDLPLKGFFVPILHRTVQYLSGQSVAQAPEYLVGTTINKQLEKLPVGQTAKAVAPDSSEFYLEPIPVGEKLLLKFADTDLAGIYELFIGDERIDAYPINVDTKESDLKILQKSEINKKIKKAVLINEDSDLSKAILESRYGKELWKEFLIAVLLLMVLEMPLCLYLKLYPATFLIE